MEPGVPPLKTRRWFALSRPISGVAAMIGSLSVIVTMEVLAPLMPAPPAGLLRVAVKVSLASETESSRIGTVIVLTVWPLAKETTREAPLVIADVEQARARREKLRDLVNAARRERGVREIDMVHEDLGEPV